jgi:hypothetical protein
MIKKKVILLALISFLAKEFFPGEKDLITTKIPILSVISFIPQNKTPLTEALIKKVSAPKITSTYFNDKQKQDIVIDNLTQAITFRLLTGMNLLIKPRGQGGGTSCKLLDIEKILKTIGKNHENCNKKTEVLALLENRITCFTEHVLRSLPRLTQEEQNLLLRKSNYEENSKLIDLMAKLTEPVTGIHTGYFCDINLKNQPLDGGFYSLNKIHEENEKIYNTSLLILEKTIQRNKEIKKIIDNIIKLSCLFIFTGTIVFVIFIAKKIIVLTLDTDLQLLKEIQAYLHEKKFADNKTLRTVEEVISLIKYLKYILE